MPMAQHHQGVSGITGKAEPVTFERKLSYVLIPKVKFVTRERTLGPDGIAAELAPGVALAGQELPHARRAQVQLQAHLRRRLLRFQVLYDVRGACSKGRTCVKQSLDTKDTRMYTCNDLDYVSGNFCPAAAPCPNNLMMSRLLAQSRRTSFAAPMRITLRLSSGKETEFCGRERSLHPA